MVTEKDAPETQDTHTEQQEELFFGKYKTKEEAEAAMKEMERERTEAKEALDREQRLNQLLSSEESTQPERAQETTAQQYVGLQNVFDEEQTAAMHSLLKAQQEQIMAQVRREGRKMIDDFKVRQETEKEFYETYTDLANFKDEVDFEANRLAFSLGEKVQKIPMKELMKEVAKRTRERLAIHKSKLTKSTIHLESGEVLEPEVKVEKTPVETTAATPEERTQKFFDTEVKAFNEKRLKPLRG